MPLAVPSVVLLVVAAALGFRFRRCHQVGLVGNLELAKLVAGLAVEDHFRTHPSNLAFHQMQAIVEVMIRVVRLGLTDLLASHRGSLLASSQTVLEPMATLISSLLRTL